MTDKKTVYMGSDHAGFNLKKYLIPYLEKTGYNPVDIGNTEYNQGDDYPDYALKLAEKVASENGRGILVCNNGIGVCIVANKVRGIRAVNAYSPLIAVQSRQHNDSNILCLGQNFITPDLAKKTVSAWLETEFGPEERHHRRVEKINNIS